LDNLHGCTLDVDFKLSENDAVGLIIVDIVFPQGWKYLLRFHFSNLSILDDSWASGATLLNSKWNWAFSATLSSTFPKSAASSYGNADYPQLLPWDP
jgi:hypothetical protein